MQWFFHSVSSIHRQYLCSPTIFFNNLKMARVFFSVLFVSTALFMAIALPVPDDPPPPPPASGPGGNSGSSNNGIFVNGINCTQYVTQCQSNSQNINSSSIPVTPPPGQDNIPSNSTSICNNQQAQQFCGGLTNNPITTNLQNSTIQYQNQMNQFPNATQLGPLGQMVPPNGGR